MTQLKTYDPTQNLWPNSGPMTQLRTYDPTRDLWPNSGPLTQLGSYDSTRDIWFNSGTMTQLAITQLGTYDPNSGPMIPTRDLWPNSRPMNKLETNDSTPDLWPNLKHWTQLKTYYLICDLGPYSRPRIPQGLNISRWIGMTSLNICLICYFIFLFILFYFPVNVFYSYFIIHLIVCLF